MQLRTPRSKTIAHLNEWAPLAWACPEGVTAGQAMLGAIKGFCMHDLLPVSDDIPQPVWRVQTQFALSDAEQPTALMHMRFESPAWPAIPSMTHLDKVLCPEGTAMVNGAPEHALSLSQLFPTIAQSVSFAASAQDKRARRSKTTANLDEEAPLVCV